MKNTKTNILTLAVQKEGRLTEGTLDFLCKSGLEFERYKSRLFSICRNFPLELLFVRDDDIADYVVSGVVDLGIVGQNILSETRPNVKKLLNLRFGFCSLVVAVPKESGVQTIQDLEGKTVATTYPTSTTRFFEKNNVAIKTVRIGGSVEIAPTLGIAQAVTDLVSTGSTMALNDLRPLTKIYNSEAILIANSALSAQKQKSVILTQLLTRFTSVLSAKNYKCVTMSIPKKIASKLAKSIPSLLSPTFFPSAKENCVILQTLIKEDVFWESVERLKKLGASKIIIQSVEKIII